MPRAIKTAPMKAAVCYEFGAPLVVDDLDLEAPRAGEVTVKIAACAICHSDITYIDGGWGGRLPKVFGHEAAGVVAEVGRGVDSVTVGQRVLVTLLRACGQCGACARGRPNICGAQFPLDREARMKNARGETVKQGLRTGAFAEYALVHPSQLAPIPDDLPFDEAALLSCGVITGFGAVVNTARLPAGASAAVIGCGGVGLNAVQGAAFAGAHPLVAVDVVAAKLHTALEFGATHTVDASALGADNLRAAIDAITGDGLEFVFTAVGNPRVIEQGLELLAPGGALVIVGMPPTGELVAFDATDLAATGQRIISSKMGATRLRADIPKLLALHRAGRLKLGELISNRYPLADINHAIAEVRADKALRNVIVF